MDCFYFSQGVHLKWCPFHTVFMEIIIYLFILLIFIQEDTSTSQQTAEMPKKNKTPKKRSRDSQKREADENVTSRSRKRKAPPSENKIGHKTNKSAVIGRKNKSKRKELKTKQDESTSSMATTDKRNDQLLVDHSEDLSASELDGNFNLSDNRDSTFLCDADVQQSDRDFLQQQIKVLKTPFELEVDCTALSRIRGQLSVNNVSGL